MGILWECLQHGCTSIVIAQIVLTVHWSLLISPRIKRLREAVYGHTPQLSLLRQMPVVRQHIAHQIAKQVVAVLGYIATIHQYAAWPQPVAPLFHLWPNA